MSLGFPILEVRGLSVVYEMQGEPVRALSDINLTLHRGEMMAVIGESGSGKTTLARGMLRLLPANGRIATGSVVLSTDRGGDFLGARGTELRSLRGAGIGFVPQATAGALNPVQRIQQHFRSTLLAHRLEWRRTGRARSERALAEAGLADTRSVMRAYPHELSGGMAQRVVVALATVLEPAVLIADEPTSALDATVQRRLLDNLAANVRLHERGAIVITHDIGIARAYCDSVLVMFAGFVVEAGPIDAVLGSPLHPYTKALLESVPGPHRARSFRPGVGGGTATPAPAGDRCPYYDQCPVRGDPRCQAELPPLRELAAGQVVRGFCA